MFNLSLNISDLDSSPDAEKVTQAFIELHNGAMRAYLNLSIPEHIVLELVKAIQTEENQSQEDMAQDIACELMNVIGHATGNYFNELPGNAFNIGLPKPGRANTPSIDLVLLSLHFLNKHHYAATLDVISKPSS
jgi:hypothetical protein